MYKYLRGCIVRACTTLDEGILQNQWPTLGSCIAQGCGIKHGGENVITSAIYVEQNVLCI